MDSNDSDINKSSEPTKMDEPEASDSASGSDKKSPDKWPAGGKRLKKDDSGINVMPESDISDDLSDSLANSNCENKALENSCQSELNSSDSGNLESCSTGLEPKVLDDNCRTPESKNLVSSDISDSDDDAAEVKLGESSTSTSCDETKKLKRSKLKCKRKSADVSSDDDEEEEEKAELKRKREEEKRKQDEKKYDPTPCTPRPVHHWSAPKSVISRQFGFSCNYSPDLFRFKCYGSLHMVQRLELMYKMRKHDGCVNGLNFNTTGTKLVTGSDDLRIVVWDWTTSEPLLDYSSGHTSNVFQAKFLPYSGDCHIVTCARDGQVRLGELSSSGVCKGTRKLGQHRGATHKLGLQKDNPHVFLSCAEDGHVLLFDIRMERRKDNPQKLVTSMENGKKVSLYSLACNPQKPHEYVVGGKSPYVRVYDTRYSTEESACVKKFCPEHLVNREVRANVTSAVYNYNGEEILASYNEDIYLFNSYETDSSKYLHRYRGHRNSQTIKGVNFFGSKSEYIVSGSDCGYIFFWDKESEHIVKYMYGDEMGVVNCIEPHPNMPVLATSGLDDDIKIWVPSCENEPDLSKLRKHVIENIKEQEEDNMRDCSEAFVDQSILFLMQHLSSARFRQAPVLWSEGGNRDSSNSSTSDDSDTEGRPALQCTQS